MPVYINTIDEIKKKLKIQENGPAQAFLVSTCAKRMDKYVPFSSGTLAKYTLTKNAVIYSQEYAAYQYYGVRKDNTHQINPANRDRSKHPLATSYWAEKMKTAEMEDIQKEMQNFIGGKQ